MTKITITLQFLRESIQQFPAYLLSDELFWPMGGTMPRLTPGSFLLELQRLSIYLPAEAELLKNNLDLLKIKWQFAWNKKISREKKNRSKLWAQYVSELKESSQHDSGYYSNEVRGRLILQLLCNENPEPSDNQVIDDLDKVVKFFFHSGDFIWEKEIQSGFPRDNFWYLYGNVN